MKAKNHCQKGGVSFSSQRSPVRLLVPSNSTYHTNTAYLPDDECAKCACYKFHPAIGSKQLKSTKRSTAEKRPKYLQHRAIRRMGSDTIFSGTQAYLYEKQSPFYEYHEAQLTVYSESNLASLCTSFSSYNKWKNIDYSARTKFASCCLQNIKESTPFLNWVAHSR